MSNGTTCNRRNENQIVNDTTKMSSRFISLCIEGGRKEEKEINLATSKVIAKVTLLSLPTRGQ
jgi:hypothetical protein